MPRNMSFALTTKQFKARTKRVTRRLGWDYLQPGDLLWGVEKAMGLSLKKGEKINRLGLIEVTSAFPEPLNTITQEDVALEGFPDWTPKQFVNFFCDHNKIEPETIVNRIDYDYIGYLVTQEMLDDRLLPRDDAELGELVFKSTDLCPGWVYTKPFYVSVRTLCNWLQLKDMDGCHANYARAVDYYLRAYGKGNN